MVGGSKVWRDVTMAQAELNDGQRLLAVNDLFIGARTHVSARYRSAYQGREEDQSSSGLIVSTGAGSTGWYRSLLTGAAGVVACYVAGPEVAQVREQYAIPWEDRGLVFCVREPFVSKTSGAEIVHGRIAEGPTAGDHLAHAPERCHLQRRRRGRPARFQQRRHCAYRPGRPHLESRSARRLAAGVSPGQKGPPSLAFYGQPDRAGSLICT